MKRGEKTQRMVDAMRARSSLGSTRPVAPALYPTSTIPPIPRRVFSFSAADALIAQADSIMDTQAPPLPEPQRRDPLRSILQELHGDESLRPGEVLRAVEYTLNDSTGDGTENDDGRACSGSAGEAAQGAATAGPDIWAPPSAARAAYPGAQFEAYMKPLSTRNHDWTDDARIDPRIRA